MRSIFTTDQRSKYYICHESTGIYSNCIIETDDVTNLPTAQRNIMHYYTQLGIIKPPSI